MKHSKSSGSTKTRSASGKRKSGSAPSKSKRKLSEGGTSRKPRRRVVMGLDLSLTGTGLVVWDGERILRRRRYKTELVAPSDGLKLRPHGQLAPDRFAGDNEARIEWLRRKAASARRKFQVELVVIESKHFGSKGSAKAVDELQGVIKNDLHRHEVAFVLRTPNQLKKHLCGNGQASKQEMIAAAKKFDRGISNDDEADAFAAAHEGHEKWREFVED